MTDVYLDHAPAGLDHNRERAVPPTGLVAAEDLDAMEEHIIRGHD